MKLPTWSKTDREKWEWDLFLLETKTIFFLLNHLQVVYILLVLLSLLKHWLLEARSDLWD